MEKCANTQAENESRIIDRYATVTKWALFMTRYDHDLSADLVQDLYLRLASSPNIPSDGETINKYLYVALRNSYISQIRYRQRTFADQLSIKEGEAAFESSWSIDPRDAMRVREQLLAICHFASVRKRTSNSASVFILRFFHGYVPREIGRILRCSRNVVESHLVSSRREISRYLQDASFLNDLSRRHSQLRSRSAHEGEEDVFAQLRRRIFAAREGQCRTLEDIRLYYSSRRFAMPRILLSHLVSCGSCLENVNDVLGLPGLDQRFLIDSLNRDRKSQDE